MALDPLDRRELLEARNHTTESLSLIDGIISRDDSIMEPVPFSPTTTTGRVGIAIGHSRRGDKGAGSVDGTFEWDYNRTVGIMLEAKLNARGIVTEFYDDYHAEEYTDGIDWLAARLRNFNADCVLELHFNSYNGHVEDEEYLYWHSSPNGRRLAGSLLAAHKELDPDPKSRGIKPKSRGNGAYFLKETPCPAVICEPLFGDNLQDWGFWKDRPDLLSDIYDLGIANYLTEA